MDWESAVGRLVCPKCGQHYQLDRVSVMRAISPFVFVRCDCPCGLVAAAVFKTEDRSPIIEDEVRMARQLLDIYKGDAHGLFEAIKES